MLDIIIIINLILIIILIGITILILFKLVSYGKIDEDIHRLEDNIINYSSTIYDRLHDDIDILNNKVNDELRHNRQEIISYLDKINTSTRNLQKELLEQEIVNSNRLHNTLSQQSESLNKALTDSVYKLQESNEKKLDQMRQTVDEKLDETLSKRLNTSFKSVGEQLENVYKSLGEMKELSSGVSNLQRVLTNVKARGVWAEVQLDNILSQILTCEQYSTNVSIKNNRERVEFAIKIPSKDDNNSFVWLPIDSKFPQEDYLRILDAAENADKDALDMATQSLERRIREDAKTISELYIDVPNTTDFAILFVPTEGLYAELLRRNGLLEDLQTKFRIMVAGPTTITAFLNTLQVGFRTIAIDQKASEVWKVLGAAKTQLDKFEVILSKAKKKLQEADNALSDAETRNRAIRRSLRDVESGSIDESDQLLEIINNDDVSSS